MSMRMRTPADPGIRPLSSCGEPNRMTITQNLGPLHGSRALNISGFNETTHDAKFLTIGIDGMTLGDNCRNASQDMFACDLLSVQVALYFAALATPPGYHLRTRVYEEEEWEQIFMDLDNGTLDTFPAEMLMGENVPQRYYWTMPVASSGYVMYSSMQGIRDSMSESPIQFLTAPFTRGVWFAVIASAVCMFLLAPFLLNQRRNSLSHLTRNMFLVAVFAYAFLAAIYSSQLKALLTSQSTSVPFQNLYDLAKKIEQGTKRMVVEDKNSFRWGVLAKKEYWKPPPLVAVYDAVQYRGIESAVVYEPNVTKICDMMESSTQYVYFGYEEILLSSCSSRQCLWKYPVVEYPEMPVTIPVSKHSPMREIADLAVHALDNYRRILIHRRDGGTCIPVKSEKELIGMRSLIGAVILLGGGLVISTVVLIAEKLIDGRQVGFFYMVG